MYLNTPYMEKRVTIAAGFVCMDGVVLCADTQETIPGYTKNKTQKINMYMEQHFTVAITGAGDSEMIEALSQHLISAATSKFTFSDRFYGHKAKLLMEGALVDFFTRFLLPYPHHERPPVELLVAVQSFQNRYLYKASGNILRSLDPGVSEGAACIGSGALLAKSLMERLYNPFLELADLVTIACYVTYQAKRWVDGCGGNTDLYVMTDKYRMGVRSDDIEAMETLFARYDSLYDALLTASINPHATNSTISLLIARLRSELIQGRKKLMSEQPELREFYKKIRKQRRRATR